MIAAGQGGPVLSLGMKMVTPIRRRKLYEEVSDRIEAMIHEGRFPIGEQLPAERDLATEFGVGRSAVREAIFSLQKMGLVSVSNGERARVVSPSAKTMLAELSGAARLLLRNPSGMAQFQQARALFEVGLARLAAETAVAEDLDNLARALEANRASMADLATFQRTDVEFHLVIARISGNAIFVSIHEAVVEWLMAQRVASSSAPGAPEAAFSAHRLIYEAIAAHDPERAQKAMQDHLDTVKAYYWKAVESMTHDRDVMAAQ